MSADMDADLDRFAVPLPPIPGTVVDDDPPLLLTRDEQREVNAKLDDIARARAQAIAHAHEVVVWR